MAAEDEIKYRIYHRALDLGMGCIPPELVYVANTKKEAKEYIEEHAKIMKSSPSFYHIEPTGKRLYYKDL